MIEVLCLLALVFLFAYVLGGVTTYSGIKAKVEKGFLPYISIDGEMTWTTTPVKNPCTCKPAGDGQMKLDNRCPVHGRGR